jgi:hypothetical protein
VTPLATHALVLARDELEEGRLGGAAAPVQRELRAQHRLAVHHVPAREGPVEEEGEERVNE